MGIAEKLRATFGIGLLSLALVGCNSKEKGPLAGDRMSLRGKIVKIASFRPEMVGGYPATTRDIRVESKGRIYHISTTGPNKWKEISLGDSVYLSGQYKYSYNFRDEKFKDEPIDVTYATLEPIKRKSK